MVFDHPCAHDHRGGQRPFLHDDSQSFPAPSRRRIHEKIAIRTAARQQLPELSMMVGISIGDTTRDHDRQSRLGQGAISKPLFHGDTIHVQTEVVEVRASRSKPDRGIVTSFIGVSTNTMKKSLPACESRSC